MISASRALLWTTRAGALAGFFFGGLHAILDVAGAKHVREFQAGASAPITERVVAVLQRAALEGIGFGICAFVLGLFALVASAPGGTNTTRGQRFSAWFLLSTAALTLWANFGTWLGNEALPFLDAGPLALLNLVGFSACLVSFALAWGLVRLMPFSPRRQPAAVALGTALAIGGALYIALDFLLTSPAPKAVGTLSQAVGIVLAGVPVAGFLGRLTVPLVAAFGERAQGSSFLPRSVRLGAWAGLAVAAVVTAFTLELRATPAEVSYGKVEGRGAPDGPNVVLVTIDTLRADHLSCYGYDRPTSPFIDSIAADGTLFADASSAAAWTKPATGTILTGLYPSRHGALYHGSSLQLPEGEKTLAETFRDAGYVTAGFVTNPNVKRIFDFDRGFDEFFDSPVEDTVTLASIRGSTFGRLLMRLFRHQFNWKYENDVFQMNRHILAWLRENKDQRFFLYLHYIDPHIPYTPPSPFKEEFERDHGFVTFNERKGKVGVDLYDGEIRYTDEGMKELVEEMQALGLWDNTVFAMTSDHGEEFFEHEVMGHGFSLYQGVIHVPLIFRGPGIPKGLVVDEPVQVVDMPATLAEVAGVGAGQLGDGRSFTAAFDAPDWEPAHIYFLENEFGTDHNNNRSFVFSGARRGEYKLVLTEKNLYRPWAAREEFYDLSKDPAEKNNLIQDEAYRDLIQELTDSLEAHSEMLFKTGFRDIEPAAISEEVQEQMRMLGYAGD